LFTFPCHLLFVLNQMVQTEIAKPLVQGQLSVLCLSVSTGNRRSTMMMIMMMMIQWSSSNSGVRGSDHDVLGKIALREFLMGKTGLRERGRLWPLFPSKSLKIHTFFGLQSAWTADAASFRGGWLSNCPCLCACIRIFQLSANFHPPPHTFIYFQPRIVKMELGKTVFGEQLL
jgi:hypothetical protein